MAEREGAAQNKQTDVDQKHRVRQKESELSFDQFHAWDTGPFSLTETPFVPCTDEHTELLAMSPSDEARANLVLHLQQAYGNRYVQRLIESRAVQAKLTVNAPNDIYEQEADRVADVVTRAVNSQAQRQEVEQEKEIQMQPVEEEEELQMKTSQVQCQEVPEEEEVQMQPVEEEEELQMQRAEGQPDTVSESIEARINNARGNGHPLSENVREPMEQAFEADFSAVRVHTDSEANLLNQQLSARAFTTARDIFFRQGEYSPGSDNGRRLIAHELTHVVQQGKGRVSKDGLTVLQTFSAIIEEKNRGEMADPFCFVISTPPVEFASYHGSTLPYGLKRNDKDITATFWWNHSLATEPEFKDVDVEAPTEENWKNQILGLASMGAKGTWYSSRAVAAHETVHLVSFTSETVNMENKLKKSMKPGAELKGKVHIQPLRQWRWNLNKMGEKQHENGSTDNAELGIISPKIQEIWKVAKDNKWADENMSPDIESPYGRGIIGKEELTI